MSKFRKRRGRSTPEMQISPMIDMIFLLLVFFIVSTMHMSQVKTVPVKLPVAQNTQNQKKTTLNIAVKADNTIWLEDKKITLDNLVQTAKTKTSGIDKVSAVIRADTTADYGTVIRVMDKLKGAGVTQFGMAADSGRDK